LRFLFHRVLRCFTSPGFAFQAYVFNLEFAGITRRGFPHSDISGSKRACRSPKLIAACCVLHRLPVPRHSPYALSSLTNKLVSIFGELLRPFVYAIVKEPPHRAPPEAGLSGKVVDERKGFGICCVGMAARLRFRLPRLRRGIPIALYASGWWACLNSNQGPRPYQGRALTN
jgi:hypothetical protein